MQTRSQALSDTYPDQLIKLFHTTLSTVTPNRNNSNENDEIIPSRNRQRRLRQLRPLPLCLSDNEKKYARFNGYYY